MKEYDHKKLEKNWQSIWEKKKIYQAQDLSKKPKYYSLIEFPYPSGDGLHVGHPRPYIGMDVISRKRRMEGFNVLYPIGWDAFGLPTENYAIKTGKDPRIVTKQNTDTFRRQIKSLGISFDWSREVNTTDPKYYKWTQWIFLQFFKKGLAYKKKMMINWCPKDKIGLANEEVIGGVCERCGTAVEKREKEQWMLAITKYAERLDKDLDDVDYLPKIKLAQRNWIGKSEGVEIEFQIFAASNFIKVFTTRPDTIFGVTFLALAPEVAEKLTGKDFGIKVDTDRENKEKIGVDTGLKAKNPASGEIIPVFVVNYVSAEYGTGAIMGVPAHDERDFEFAKKYKLPIKQVVSHIVHNTEGPYAVREGIPFRNRDAVMCIVKHWEKNEYLCQEWKDFSEVRTLISGGIEKGEDIVSAGKREIKEESGYMNPKFIKQLGGFSYIEFYHQRKQTNMRARFRYLYFELKDGEKISISEVENKQHRMVWKKPDEVLNFINISEKERIWELFNGKEEFFTGPGYLVHSGKFDGMDSEKAKKEITKFIGGKEKTTFKLRDWVFSRQRYWGEPIPVVNCEKCGLIPVPEKDLPVELPKVKNYQPTESGESPLANISKWVNTKCPKCKGKAERETDTMPNWAGSSWYYLRYTDPKNNKAFASRKNLEYWLQGNALRKAQGDVGGVDWYNGGNEHTTLHLLYSRFWHKFLFDLGLVPTNEPYMKRTSHGLILAEGGEKMSKSKGNVINPDDIVKIYGADTLRLYEMFMGPFDQAIAWSEEAIIGPRRFLEKVWKIASRVKANQHAFENDLTGIGDPDNRGPEQKHLVRLLNKTIKKVSEDIENMHFNTAISTMMIFTTEMERAPSVLEKDFKMFLQLLSPFAPHITEELWATLGNKKTITLSQWPKWDENLIKDEELKIVIQINGKVRAEILIRADENEENIKKKALADETIIKYMAEKKVKRIVYVKKRLINIVL